MPLVQVHLVEGRTAEQKRRLLEAVSRAVEETLGSPRSSIRVWLNELRAEHYMVAGELFSERGDRGA